MNRGSGVCEKGRSRRPKCSRYIASQPSHATAGPSAGQRAAPAHRGPNALDYRWRARLAPMAEAHGACAELAGSRGVEGFTDAGHDADLSPDLVPLHLHDACHLDVRRSERATTPVVPRRGTEGCANLDLADMPVVADKM